MLGFRNRLSAAIRGKVKEGPATPLLEIFCAFKGIGEGLGQNAHVLTGQVEIEVSLKNNPFDPLSI
jgi:hypothetical protein